MCVGVNQTVQVMSFGNETCYLSCATRPNKRSPLTNSCRLRQNPNRFIQMCHPRREYNATRRATRPVPNIQMKHLQRKGPIVLISQTPNPLVKNCNPRRENDEWSKTEDANRDKKRPSPQAKQTPKQWKPVRGHKRPTLRKQCILNLPTTCKRRQTRSTSVVKASTGSKEFLKQEAHI